MGGSKYWCYTINNPTSFEFTKIPSEYHIWQLEQGDKETQHVQGYITFSCKKVFNTVKKLFSDAGSDQVHLEYRRGTHDEAKSYCMKEDTRLEGPFESGSDEKIPKKKGERMDLLEVKKLIDEGKEDYDIYQTNFSAMLLYQKNFHNYKRIILDKKEEKLMKEEFEDFMLRPWQVQVLEELENQNDRQVLWIVDEEGGKGKTTLARWLQIHSNAFYSSGGRYGDIAYAYNNQDIVIFDYTRATKEFVNYDIIEAFKNGLIWCSKYESKIIRKKGIKVICFSNWTPDKEKMSKDRWNIITL